MLVGLPTTPFPAITPGQLVRRVKHLPCAPKVLPRLKHLLSDGNSAIAEIVALVGSVLDAAAARPFDRQVFPGAKVA